MSTIVGLADYSDAAQRRTNDKIRLVRKRANDWGEEAQNRPIPSLHPPSTSGSPCPVPPPTRTRATRISSSGSASRMRVRNDPEAVVRRHRGALAPFSGRRGSGAGRRPSPGLSHHERPGLHRHQRGGSGVLVRLGCRQAKTGCDEGAEAGGTPAGTRGSLLVHA